MTGFPIELVDVLVEECKLQHFVNVIPTFQNNTAKTAMLTLMNYGFDWNKTTNGLIFWTDVLIHKNFGLFFKFYSKEIINNKVYIYQDGTVNPNLLIKTLETYGAVNEGNYNGEHTGSYYYIDPNNKIGVIHSKYITTVELIKDNYTEIKVPKEKKTIKISKSLMMGILSLSGNAEDYNFEFDD